jgi:hypothetical protein
MVKRGVRPGKTLSNSAIIFLCIFRLIFACTEVFPFKESQALLGWDTDLNGIIFAPLTTSISKDNKGETQ